MKSYIDHNSGIKLRLNLCHPKAMMELIGTAILVGTLQMCYGVSPDKCAQARLAISVGLTYMAYDISGAHFNPAVTLTHLLRRRCSPRRALAYIAMQLLGGAAGATLARTVSHASALHLRVGPNYSWPQAAFAETFCTMIVCLLVLCVVLRRDVKVDPVFGVAVASVVYSGCITFGPVSGASFNPAISIGLCVANGLTDLYYAVFTSGFNIFAACLATMLFFVMAPEEYQSVTTCQSHSLLPLSNKLDESVPLLNSSTHCVDPHHR